MIIIGSGYGFASSDYVSSVSQGFAAIWWFYFIKWHTTLVKTFWDACCAGCKTQISNPILKESSGMLYMTDCSSWIVPRFPEQCGRMKDASFLRATSYSLLSRSCSYFLKSLFIRVVAWYANTHKKGWSCLHSSGQYFLMFASVK